MTISRSMQPAEETRWRAQMAKILAEPDEYCPGSVYLSMALRIRDLESASPTAEAPPEAIYAAAVAGWVASAEFVNGPKGQRFNVREQAKEFATSYCAKSPAACTCEDAPFTCPVHAWKPEAPPVAPGPGWLRCDNCGSVASPGSAVQLGEICNNCNVGAFRLVSGSDVSFVELAKILGVEAFFSDSEDGRSSVPSDGINRVRSTLSELRSRVSLLEAELTKARHTATEIQDGRKRAADGFYDRIRELEAENAERRKAIGAAIDDLGDGEYGSARKNLEKLFDRPRSACIPGIIPGSEGAESGEIAGDDPAMTRAGLEPATYGLKGPDPIAGNIGSEPATTTSVGAPSDADGRSAPENSEASPDKSPDDHLEASQ